jgi:hypothetical protein
MELLFKKKKDPLHILNVGFLRKDIDAYQICNIISFYSLSTCLVVIADMFQSELVIVRLDTTKSKYNDMSYQDNW